jgi:hypothetical protein
VDGSELTDGVLILAPLVMSDAAEWLAGEDHEQRRWFESPPSRCHLDVERFIGECEASWRTGGEQVVTFGSGASAGPALCRSSAASSFDALEAANLSHVVFPLHRRQASRDAPRDSRRGTPPTCPARRPQ